MRHSMTNDNMRPLSDIELRALKDNKNPWTNTRWYATVERLTAERDALEREVEERRQQLIAEEERADAALQRAEAAEVNVEVLAANATLALEQRDAARLTIGKLREVLEIIATYRRTHSGLWQAKFDAAERTAQAALDATPDDGAWAKAQADARVVEQVKARLNELREWDLQHMNANSQARTLNKAQERELLALLSSGEQKEQHNEP